MDHSHILGSLVLVSVQSQCLVNTEKSHYFLFPGAQSSWQKAIDSSGKARRKNNSINFRLVWPSGDLPLPSTFLLGALACEMEIAKSGNCLKSCDPVLVIQARPQFSRSRTFLLMQLPETLGGLPSLPVVGHSGHLISNKGVCGHMLLITALW